ncbi:IclR family transcriptional regulator C-terminal domain-containing protein [Dactylosporangium sp. NPDC005572]|uniref:IclR family transcriptional regulator n=1 Tax=Dactylosporangium sp. NPDC005572 TaxID=3156889 RepID=UPI0033B86223
MPDESPTLDLLERLSAASDRMTFDALLRQVGLPEKVLRRRLQQLVDRGWVDAFPADGYAGETHAIDDPSGEGRADVADDHGGSANAPRSWSGDARSGHPTAAARAVPAVAGGGRAGGAVGRVDRARVMTFAIAVGALRPGSAFLSGDRAARLAGPILARARDLVDESFRLVRLDGTAIVCLASRESSRDMAGTPVGRRLPAYAAASGRAILAYRPRAEVEALLDQGVEAHTVDSVVDRDGFFAELAEARERGWAYERGQLIPGVGCIAAAVLPLPGEPDHAGDASDRGGDEVGSRAGNPHSGRAGGERGVDRAGERGGSPAGERGGGRAGGPGRGRHAASGGGQGGGGRGTGLLVTDAISCGVPLARLTDDHAEDIAEAVLRATHDLALALRG